MSVGGKCNWQHSMAHPRKPPYRRKNLLCKPSYSPFCPKFRYQWQRRSIEGKCDWLHSMAHLQTLPYRRKKSCRYLLHTPSYSPFCPKFCCHGNQRGSEVKLNDTIRLDIPKNHILEPKITTLSYTQPKLWPFKELFNFPHRRYCIFLFLRISTLNIKFQFSNPKKALLCAGPRRLTY